MVIEFAALATAHVPNVRAPWYSHQSYPLALAAHMVRIRKHQGWPLKQWVSPPLDSPEKPHWLKDSFIPPPPTSSLLPSHCNSTSQVHPLLITLLLLCLSIGPTWPSKSTLHPVTAVFLFLKINLFILFIFIFGCIGSSLLHADSLQLRRAGATLRCGVRASHCGARALGSWAQ